MKDTDLATTPEELFMLIGEREFIRHRQSVQIKVMQQQIFEMSEVITKLREDKDGRLGKPADNDAV